MQNHNDTASLSAKLKDTLREALVIYYDFPKPGIFFEDILPIFVDPKKHELLIQALVLRYKEEQIDIVVGLEARGFLFGPTLALRLGAGFVPVRKPGKLPGKTISEAYAKEYGTDVFEIQAGSIKKGQRVLIVDDIIATGGTAVAAGNLVKQLEGELVGYGFVLEIAGLNGRGKLNAEVFTLL